MCDTNDREGLDILAMAIKECIGDLNIEIIPSTNTKPKEKALNNSSNVCHKTRDSLKRRQPLNEVPLPAPTGSNPKPAPITKNKSSFPLSYELFKIMRRHTRRTETNENSKTSIWDIKYRPISRRYYGSHLVVTCGANIVNLLDLKTGSVCSRYEDSSSAETFNCIVWTDFIVNTINGVTRDLSLLCVGGTKKDNKQTDILFLNSDDMSDYFKVKSHSQSVNCLLFHPNKKNLLFSGGYDRKIMLWKLDSGKMTHLSKLSSMTVRKLTEIDCNNRILSLVFAKNLNVLVVSGEDGIVLVKQTDSTQHKDKDKDKDKDNTSLLFNVELKEKKKVIDGLVMVGSDSDLLAFRLKEVIIVADLKKMVESADSKRAVPLVVVCRLQYCPQKCDYFYMTIESRLLCCGSADGQILIYYLKDSILKAQQKENPLEPIRVLPKPRLNNFANKSLLKPPEDPVFVNIAAVSRNHEYIVGGTNNNLICIWKRINQRPHDSSQSLPSNKKLKTVAKI